MGINIILPIIAGVIATIIIGGQVAPSYMENIKIKKVENVTLANQEMVKDAIVRYIKLGYGVPKTTQDLIDKGLILEAHTQNSFNKSYSFYIDPDKGILKIYTKLDDDDSGRYFSNSMKYSNRPISCNELKEPYNSTECNPFDANFVTMYLIDNKGLLTEEQSTIIDKFNKNNIGAKDYGQNEEIDYVVEVDPENDGKFIVTEYIKDENGNFVEGNTHENVIIAGENSKDNVFEFDSKNRIKCELGKNVGKTIFVVNNNENLDEYGQGELIYIAPDDMVGIKRKMFGDNHVENHEPFIEGVQKLMFFPNQICMTNVGDMGYLLADTSFNHPLDRWDVSNVWNMGGLFFNDIYGDFGGIDNVFNQNLNSWDTSNVIDMSEMFLGANNFNNGCKHGDFTRKNKNNEDVNCDLTLNTSNVANMEDMFKWAENFNQKVSSFNTSNVTNMEGMFLSMPNFNNGCSITDVNDTNCPLLTNGDIWNMEQVQYASSMFKNNNKFNQNIGNWNLKNVEHLSQMFDSASSFNQSLSNWNTSKVTYMAYMFWGASAFNQDLSSWCVSKISSKPHSFDTNTPIGFRDNASVQPKWGEPCPPQ